MKAYFKGKFTKANKINVGIDNRQFLYGDGFFETMLSHNGSVKYLQYHIDRIKSALTALNISFPVELSHDLLSEIISDLAEQNEIKPFAKVKIHVWREEGGTYSPLKDKGELLVSIAEIVLPKIPVEKRASLATKVKNHYSETSQFKSSSALNYVLAGIEKRERGLDDIIITDRNNCISECLVSNIFWVENEKIFTPSLETGCISGVGRRILIEHFKMQNKQINEVQSSTEVLMDVDHVFTTNALGLSHITDIEGKKFTPFSGIEKVLALY